MGYINPVTYRFATEHGMHIDLQMILVYTLNCSNNYLIHLLATANWERIVLQMSFPNTLFQNAKFSKPIWSSLESP